MNVLQSPPVQNDTVTLVTHGDNRRNETLLTLLSYGTGITTPFGVILRGIQEHLPGHAKPFTAYVSNRKCNSYYDSSFV